MGWIRIRMDPELLPGSGTQKIQSWIRNKSFRIHNTGLNKKKFTKQKIIRFGKILCHVVWHLFCAEMSILLNLVKNPRYIRNK